jgi:hypothetical protein
MLALDDRGPESLLRETVCERWAGLARTNDNRVEFPGHGHRYNHIGIRVQSYGAGNAAPKVTIILAPVLLP